ncbi:MAG: hypothetical protein K2X47_19570, partial [Bdellovibrionales bacterium]|nr:hypothetical protein [Bdellovibrionales bacterium]
QRKIRIEGRNRLLAFQRGELTRQNRSIASPQSQVGAAAAGAGRGPSGGGPSGSNERSLKK